MLQAARQHHPPLAGQGILLRFGDDEPGGAEPRALMK
jgi:hypothetical protein